MEVVLVTLTILVQVAILCSCVNGICNSMNGSCTCYPNYFGSSCNSSCSCVNGTCNSMNGSCTCNPNNYGSTCDVFCLNGDYLNNTCVCHSYYSGSKCDKRCIDSGCYLSCTCNDTNSCSENICENDITIFNQNFSLIPSLNYSFEGNSLIEGSILNINSSILNFQNNLTLKNSSIVLNSSSIIVNGCLNISNSNITVDLSSNFQTNDKIFLFNSTRGCLYGESFSISYLNEPKCSILNVENDTYSLFIIFKQTNCGENQEKSQNNTWWIVLIIVIGSVIGLGIIFVVITLVTPPLRKLIFPYLRKKRESNRRTDL